jgi:tRNA(Leu) C34 or U34 (ribose-2'-O)-methylase TrmL
VLDFCFKLVYSIRIITKKKDYIMKLEFNRLPDILEFIKNPEHKDSLFLLECAIREAKTSSKSEFKVGDHVVFGRPNGRKRPGVIVTLNPKRAVIKDTNLGGKWRVPYSLMEAA